MRDGNSMKNKTTIVITVDVHPDRPFVWDHLHDMVSRYDSLKNTSIIICGSGFCPDEVKAEYKTVWSDELKREDLGLSGSLGLISSALDKAKQEGSTHVLICPMLSWCTNLPEFEDGLLISHSYRNDKEIFDTDFIYGRIETINRIMMNRKWDDALSDQQNMYLNIVNVTGKEMLNDVLIKTKDVNIIKRRIISRDYWEDLKC